MTEQRNGRIEIPLKFSDSFARSNTSAHVVTRFRRGGETQESETENFNLATSFTIFHNLKLVIMHIYTHMNAHACTHTCTHAEGTVTNWHKKNPLTSLPYPLYLLNTAKLDCGDPRKN